MNKYRVVIEVDYDGELGLERPEMPMSKSHINALMRQAVWLQMADAMGQYGFKATVKSVVGVRGKEEQ
jgi:hypothetical protein